MFAQCHCVNGIQLCCCITNESCLPQFVPTVPLHATTTHLLQGRLRTPWAVAVYYLLRLYINAGKTCAYMCGRFALGTLGTILDGSPAFDVAPFLSWEYLVVFVEHEQPRQFSLARSGVVNTKTYALDAKKITYISHAEISLDPEVRTCTLDLTWPTVAINAAWEQKMLARRKTIRQ